MRWSTQGSFPEPRPTQAFSLSHLRPIFSSSELAQPGMLPSHCVLLVCVQERECACMCLRVCIYTYKCMHCERVYVYMCLCMWKLSVYGAESYTPPRCQNCNDHIVQSTWKSFELGLWKATHQVTACACDELR